MKTQIIPLSEGEFTVGRDKIFRPFDLNKDELNERSTGSLLVEVQPFAVVNERDVLILDTGLGFSHPRHQKMLLENLEKQHIHADEVSKVLMSHLHKDHAGGLDLELFPNATFYVYKREYDHALEVGIPSYFPDELHILAHHPRVEWLEQPYGIIDDYISYEHTGGHSKEHIVFWIASDDGLIFYGGDEAPQYKQIRIKYIAKYDYDGKRAMELRQQWAEKGAAEGWTFLFYHDVRNPIVKLAAAQPGS